MQYFQPLPTSQYPLVRPLFEPLQHQLFCQAVLHHTMDGAVYVDDVSRPSTAVLAARGMWVYLAGSPSNEACTALGKAVMSGELTGPQAWGVYLSVAGDRWIEQFPSIFPDREPVRAPRLRYIATSALSAELPPLPDGSLLLKIEPGLAEQAQLSLPEDVHSLIRSWKGQQPELRDGFGFVIVHGDHVAAHAVIDCVVGDQGDIGLFTHEDYRRQGLASIVSAAAINYGLQNGLRTVVWDCGQNNTASLRTAEKLGLQLERRYNMYLVDFEEVYHYIALSADLRDQGEYTRALVCCQRVLELEAHPPAVTYYLQACAHAGLQDKAGALQSLKKAVAQGWDNIDSARSRPEFQFLHGDAEWEALVLKA
jgi:RimJ/RimL family protein N-acetyltransferase